MRRWIGVAALVAVGALTACTPEQANEWLGWNKHDGAGAQAWLASPEGQQSLTDPNIDVPAPEPPPQAARSGGCDGIYEEMIAQGASSGVAQRFAYRIAPRESGCSAQYVKDHDDWSYSRFGLNGLTSGLRATWQRWCGADVRSDTQNLSKDVECALAAYNAMGWRPWG